MITREAFNALLKIMEEPPKHLVFILATTEIDKIPKTILSRVQKFEFNKIDASKIKEQINIILKDLDIKMENEAIDLIIRKAKGAMRDALSILDQVLSFDKDEFLLKDVEFILGSVDFEKIDRLVKNIIIKDQKQSLNALIKIRVDGKSNIDIVDSLTNFYRDLMILCVGQDENSFENQERLKLLNKRLDEIDLFRILTSLDILNEYSIKISNSSNTDILAEVMVLRLIDTVDMKILESRLERLERTEKSDIVDTVNSIIDNRLKNLSVNSIREESNLEKPINRIVENEIISDQDLNKSDKIIETQEKQVVKEQTVRAVSNKDDVSLDQNTVDKIRQMIVSTSGTMLNTLFNDEGFNYLYDGKNFTLIIKDEFYRIFIETKTDDIGQNLSFILKNDVSFSLITGEVEKKNSQKDIVNDKEFSNSSEVIKKLKDIFADDLIIK